MQDFGHRKTFKAGDYVEVISDDVTDTVGWVGRVTKVDIDVCVVQFDFEFPARVASMAANNRPGRKRDFYHAELRSADNVIFNQLIDAYYVASR